MLAINSCWIIMLKSWLSIEVLVVIAVRFRLAAVAIVSLGLLWSLRSRSSIVLRMLILSIMPLGLLWEVSDLFDLSIFGRLLFCWLPFRHGPIMFPLTRRLLWLLLLFLAFGHWSEWLGLSMPCGRSLMVLESPVLVLFRGWLWMLEVWILSRLRMLELSVFFRTDSLSLSTQWRFHLGL